MANTLGTYDPIFYANEALIILYKALGLAGRVHLGYDEERRSFRRGSFVEIRKPSRFTVQDAPSTAQDLDTETTQIQLNYWREVKFALTDKELAYTQERIIEEHIEPAAFELADDIDIRLAALTNDIPWVYQQAGGTMAVADIVQSRKVLFDNAVPLRNPAMLHAMLDGTREADLLALEAFSQNQGAGDLGVNTQLTGSLGTKYGIEHFANQNQVTHTAGTADTTSLRLVGAHTKGATTVALDAAAVTGTLTAGDSFVLAGNTQRYAVTALATAAGNAFASVSISPALVQDYADDTVATVSLNGSAGAGSTRNHVPYFHRNAFALVTAPLSEMGNELGARIAVVNDPVTNLSLRSRLYYVGNSSEVHVALDVLYGVKTLDPNLAMKMIAAT